MFIIVGNTAPNCLVFAEYIVSAFNPNTENDGRLLKFVALVCITLICTLHIFSRQVGIFANNGKLDFQVSKLDQLWTTDACLALALYKVIFVIFVCVAGFVALGGVTADEKNAGDVYGKANLHDAFRQRTKTTPYGYAKSMLSILYAFRGWYETHHFLS